jgi:hypothetical protein
MAWERSFEKRVLAIREKELKYQQTELHNRNIVDRHLVNSPLSKLYPIDRTFRNGSPILVTLISFWHFAIVRHQSLTPSIAFTSILSTTYLRLTFICCLISSL